MKARPLSIALLTATSLIPAMAQTTGADATSAPTTAAAEHHQWRHHGHGGFFHELRRLNLTDAQRQQVHQIFAANKAASRTNRLNLLKAKQAFEQAVEQNPSDTTAIQTLTTNEANAAAAIKVQGAAIRAQIVKVLTADQTSQLTQIESKKQTRIQERISKLSQTSS